MREGRGERERERERERESLGTRQEPASAAAPATLPSGLSAQHGNRKGRRARIRISTAWSQNVSRYVKGCHGAHACMHAHHRRREKDTQTHTCSLSLSAMILRSTRRSCSPILHSHSRSHTHSQQAQPQPCYLENGHSDQINWYKESSTQRHESNRPTSFPPHLPPPDLPPPSTSYAWTLAPRRAPLL